MEKKHISRKCLAVGIILLFVGTCVIPANAQNTEKSQSTSRGNWLYVGGSGPGNYTKIQDAIYNASDGDTVFVYSGVYYEQISIVNAVCLLGESKYTTIIDTTYSNDWDLINLHRNNITISGFTLRLTDDGGYPRNIISNSYPPDVISNITISDNIFQGVQVDIICLRSCNSCLISNNLFSLCGGKDCIFLHTSINSIIANNSIINTTDVYDTGIILDQVSYCSVRNNSIKSACFGLELSGSDNNSISNNYFFDNLNWAIHLDFSSKNNSIFSNYIDNSIKTMLITLDWTDGLIGINIQGYSCRNNKIEKNHISHCRYGILLEDHCQYTTITKNTFKSNIVCARFLNTEFSSHNIWNQNYWGRPRVLPKPIFGIKDEYRVYPGFFEFDWHPAQEPYDIEV
jgi:parallel beta-helix repeat protein